MRVLVAPDKFKGTLTASEAAAAIAAGWRRSRPDDDVVRLPMADGGEGTLDAMMAALDGRTRSLDVSGPLGDRVRAAFGVAGGSGSLAVVEMARASGLQLVDPRRRDVLRASTFGTGELILAACRDGAREVLVCVGGSATNDGGAGMAQAVGARLLDASGAPIGPGGRALLDLASIDARAIAQEVASCRFVVAADVDNPLTGPRGASAVYGPQKGASAEDVLVLDRALGHLAAVIARDLGVDVRDIPGAGAAGGLGAGLVAFLGARIRPGAEVVMDALGFEERLVAAEAVVTGEGRFDDQSLHGKVAGAVIGMAGRAGRPTFVLCGEAAAGGAPGVTVRSLVESVGAQEAFERARGSLEDLAAEVAAGFEPLSSGR